MTFRPFDVTIPHIFYAVLGGFIVLFGMFSLLIREKLYIGEAPLAFVFGVIIGPYGANIINPRDWGGGSEATVNAITLEVTRVILAVGVFAIGVELPKAYMAKHWKSIFFLLIPVMSWGWIVSAGLIFALIPGLSFLASLAVAACLTPTDPILAAAVVGGKYADKHVPAHLRHLLAAESGCNDGAAFPFLYIAIYLITEGSDRHAIQDWFLITWLYEVILGIVFGAVLGYGFRHLMKFCEKKDLIDRQSYVAQYVSLAMFTIGVTTMLGSDDLLAAFSCGTAFAWDGFFNRQTEQAVFSSVIDLLFNIAAFVFIGAWMPFNSFTNAELTLSVWRLIVIAILVLLLRRLPIILALYKWIPDVKTFREAIFSGHFGPIGVGAVFISTLAAGVLPTPVNPREDQVEMLAATIQPIVAFMVLCSITIHGLSIPFFSLGRRVHSVSRTWSRHPSMDPNAGPEWATHTRRVSRPEDIIINRDSAMERGELSTHTSSEKLRPHSEPIVDDMEKGSSAPSTAGSAEPLKAPEGVREGDESASREGRPDSPPDGEETTAEWKEGSDLIVERRAGPGEEVDVQVMRGAAADEESTGEHILSTLRVRADEADEIMRRVKDKLRGKAFAEREELERELEKTREQIGAGSKDSEEESKKRVRISGPEQESPAESSRRPRRDDSPRDTEAEDEDEGWASDRSAPGSSIDGGRGHAETAERERRRSKSPKLKSSTKGAHTGQRRRNSFRRNILGRVRPTTAPSTISPGTPAIIEPAEEEEDERGRRAASSTWSGHGLHHRRVESLRSPISRSASPARSLRSIRFVDDSRLDPGPPASSSPTSPKQVAFDLPSNAKGA